MGARILWAVVGGFLAGVFLRSLFAFSWPVAAFLALLGCAVVLYALLDKKKTRPLIIVAVAFVACAGGMLRMDSATLRGDSAFAPLVGTNVTVVGAVAEEPDIRESSVRLVVEAESLGEETIPVKARILVVAPAHAAIEYGDKVRAEGKLDLPESFDTGAGHSFDYQSYLAKDGILYELSFARVEKVGEGVVNPAKQFALGVKRLLLAGLHEALPEPSAGLAAGITLGEKRAAGKELSDAFVRASLIHIVVLSGYNITVVINAASAALSFLPRAFRFGSSGLVVAFFILMTGGAATSVRAGLMAFLAVYARLTGRAFLATRALGVAALVMVQWNPWTLVFDPSFQLSALATLGLILFTPLYEPYLRFITTRFGLREIVATTLATQTTVLPLILHQSGNLSLVALPANVFALIAVPPAMALSALAAALGLIAGPLAPIFGFPAYALLTYIITVAQLFASIPYASVTVPAFSGWWLAPIYVALLGAFFTVQKRRAAGTSPAAS